ncbi:hypothetical protein EUTSA_v10022127mg, partial [Eutrema salsugineum]
SSKPSGRHHNRRKANPFTISRIQRYTDAENIPSSMPCRELHRSSTSTREHEIFSDIWSLGYSSESGYSTHYVIVIDVCYKPGSNDFIQSETSQYILQLLHLHFFI